jgi:SNF2 family DNA or RNA helicase
MFVFNIDLQGLVLENSAQSNTTAVVKKEEKSSRNTLVDKSLEVEEKLSTNLIASRREQQYLQDEKPCSSKSVGLAAEKLKDLHVEEKPKHKQLSNPATARKIDSDNEDQDVEMCVIGDGFSIHVDLYKRLYSYQREGILWMWKLHRMNKGGILADDMGYCTCEF